MGALSRRSGEIEAKFRSAAASAGMVNLIGPLLGGVLTVTLGWRADCWALVPLAALASAGILHGLPAGIGYERTAVEHDLLNRVVVVAALIASVRFAVMIGSLYLAEQYLQRAAGYSALGASAVLVFVAIVVAFAAPLAGWLVDRGGERLTAFLGFLLAGVGFAVLAVPPASLHSAATILPILPVGLGLGLLFVPPPEPR